MTTSEPSPATSAKSAGSILLVDDEAALLEIYTAILKSHFDVTTANNAQEADLALQQQAFKVVLADHLMPGETGLHFLTRVRKTYPRMQRLLVTGNMTPEMERVVAEENLLFAFLVKPVSIAGLVSVVKAAAHQHDLSLATT